VFLELVCRLEASSFRVDRSDLSAVKSIAYRRGNTVCENPDSDILSHGRGDNFLDKYPSPYLTGVIPAERAAVTGVITARGCNQNCTYCNCAVLSRRRFTMHSIERVVAEIDYISQHIKNSTLNIFDDAFTLVPSRAKRICRMLIENKTKVNLACITRCDHVDEELLDLMKDAGFVSIGVSLESAVPRILRIIGKVRPAEDAPTDNLDAEKQFIEKLRHVAVYAKKIGVRTVFSSIMLGLPTETLDEANQTVDMIDSITEIDTYTHNPLNIYSGTPLYSSHKKYDYAINCIGGVPIFGVTKRPQEVALRTRVSVKSHICANRKQRDRLAMKVLSLLVNRTATTSSFDNVILMADRIGDDLVHWMAESVAINATIIQLFPNRDTFILNAKANEEALYRWYAPSTKVYGYYLSGDIPSCNVVSSHAVLMRDESADTNIRARPSHEVLAGPPDAQSDDDLDRMVCFDVTSQDVYSLAALLDGIAGKEDAFTYLATRRPLPYFAGLCKWSKAAANCEVMETAIIDCDGNIRLCWAGGPVGRVGDAFEEILQAASSQKRKSCDARKCGACEKQHQCAICVAPSIEPSAYCDRVLHPGREEAADLLRTFSFLKDYLTL